MEVGETLRRRRLSVTIQASLGTWQGLEMPRMWQRDGQCLGPGGKRLGLCFDPLTQSSVYQVGLWCVLRAPRGSSCTQ